MGTFTRNCTPSPYSKLGGIADDQEVAEKVILFGLLKNGQMQVESSKSRLRGPPKTLEWRRDE